jgi:hypothetical protein
LPEPSASSNRRSGSRSSNSRKTSRRRERSGSALANAVTSTSTSMSRTIVASRFEMRALSACSIRFSRRFVALISCACSSTPSSVPYSCRSWAAVLSPIPGTPGMLSDVSPFSPMKSGTSSGGIP